MLRLHPADRRIALLMATAGFLLLALLVWPMAAFADTTPAVPTATAGLPDWLTAVLAVVTPALAAFLAWVGRQLAVAVKAWLDAKTAGAIAAASQAGTGSIKAKWELELLKLAVFVEHFLEAHLGELQDDVVKAMVDGKIDDVERAALVAKWKGVIVTQGGADALGWLKNELGAGFDLFVQGAIEKQLPKALGAAATSPQAAAGSDK
jgi:hypothetical protein